MTRPPVLLHALALLAAIASGACGGNRPEPAPAAAPAQPPNDAAHQALMGPHGDHTPRHNGLVLMFGDVHYEVVLARNGRHQVWFSDAVRNELPASLASSVTMTVARPEGGVESLTLAIDESGESWQASGKPLEGDGATVKVRYVLQGEAHETEIPVVAAILK
jgi:hypothetical protein